MISVLAQERLLGAGLGSVFTGFIVYEQRKCIYESVSEDRSRIANQSQIRGAIFGNKSHSEFACLWNKAVDQAFGPLIASLSSRKW